MTRMTGVVGCGLVKSIQTLLYNQASFWSDWEHLNTFANVTFVTEWIYSIALRLSRWDS